ncbi:hypothetical protein [Microbacterium sp. YY-01]|uniref:hypothetical protein n=1 Tax=Microbacterium sp. YY-01 TaxID=3421634 RepID=UPI003D180D2A
MLIDDIERLVEEYYERIEVSSEVRQALGAMCHAEFDRLLVEDSGELESLAKRHTEWEEERLVGLRAHYSGAISLELLKEEQMQIEPRLDDLKGMLSAHHDEYSAARATLDDCLALLASVALIYRRCEIQNRRLCNQAFFTAIPIDPAPIRRAGRIRHTVRCTDRPAAAQERAGLGGGRPKRERGANLDWFNSRKFTPRTFGVPA